MLSLFGGGAVGFIYGLGFLRVDNLINAIGCGQRILEKCCSKQSMILDGLERRQRFLTRARFTSSKAKSWQQQNTRASVIVDLSIAPLSKLCVELLDSSPSGLIRRALKRKPTVARRIERLCLFVT